MAVVGVAGCCVFPSLLAGGTLVAVAGWGWGVWAAIGVAAVVTSAWLFRRHRRRARTWPVDQATGPVPTPGVPTSAQAKVSGASVNSCCSGTADGVAMCPRCAMPGPVVGSAPVRAHRPAAQPGPWRFCANRACDAVFFLDIDVIDESEVVTQVGGKALARPMPVCFCFAHTEADIGLDVAANGGTSTIKVAVKAAVADRACACEHLNPSKSCCLPDVRRTIADAQRRVRQSVPDG
jgi:hypothetical protein